MSELYLLGLMPALKTKRYFHVSLSDIYGIIISLYFRRTTTVT